MLTALAILAGTFVYMQTGKWLGRVRHESFRKVSRGEKAPLSHLLLFPYTYINNDYIPAVLPAKADKETYVFFLSIFWPLTILWVPVGIAVSALLQTVNAFYNPKQALQSGLNALKRLTPKKAEMPALPEPEAAKNEDVSLDGLRKELNEALFEQEQSSVRVNILQEKIFLEEARLQGSYREAALPEKKE